MRAGYRAYERTQGPHILQRLGELQRLYQAIEAPYDPLRAMRTPEPDRLLPKEDQGVGRQGRLL
jgi:hypothetical protein